MPWLETSLMDQRQGHAPAAINTDDWDEVVTARDGTATRRRKVN